MRRIWKALFCPLMLGIASAADAHHGWSGYNVDFTLTGKVVKVRFINPHDQIYVEDADGNTWHFLLAPPYRNRRFGYDENSISVGETVEIVGQRSRTKFEGKVHYIKNAAGENIYTYFYDSGKTSIERQRR